MDKLVTVVMVSLLAFTIPVSIINLFWPELNASFPFSGLTSEEMNLWRLKTINPAIFLTVSYFIYRYFAGLNPTSTIWPVYVVCMFFCLTQFVGFFTGTPVSVGSSICFVLSLFFLFSYYELLTKKEKKKYLLFDKKKIKDV